ILSQSSFLTTMAPVSTAHGTFIMYLARSNTRELKAYSGASATVSIRPVCSDGTMSVDDITTGLKPPARQASAEAGSPSQVKILPLSCRSASVANFLAEKKRTKPTSDQ